MGTLNPGSRFEAAAIGVGFNAIRQRPPADYAGAGNVNSWQDDGSALYAPIGFGAFVDKAVPILPRGLFVVTPKDRAEVEEMLVQEGVDGAFPDDHILSREDGAVPQAGHDAYREVVRRTGLTGRGQGELLVMAVNDRFQIETATMAGAYVVGVTREPGGDILSRHRGIQVPRETVLDLAHLATMLGFRDQ